MSYIYSFTGKVEAGNKRGKNLGFPTANIALTQSIPEGIYASRVLIDGKTYQASTFIGEAKTFGEKEHKAESYIFDFDKNIYGKEVTVYLFKNLRGNKKFSSEQKLIEQIKKDVSGTREFFKNNTTS
ncbi:MAG: riboflavin kinase [Candidatus Levybacteria bacterium]|nr:riboflavin kinase [Candidatus Levybacteria bacterium]